MREVSTYTETVTKEELISITCDSCGKDYEGEYLDMMNDVEKININFGYGSSHDGEHWEVDVCTDCIMKWFETFKHKPKVTEYI